MNVQEMMSFGTAGCLCGTHPALALARISTAHFEHPNSRYQSHQIYFTCLPAYINPRIHTPPRTVNMRPILLSGHERALTQVKYNGDGDIIFSVSKDHVVCAWC